MTPDIFHYCVIDGVFNAEDEALWFNETAITPEAIAKVQARVRERVLRLFKRRELLSPVTVDTMRERGHEGGFSLNADVTISAWDRAETLDQTVSWEISRIQFSVAVPIA